MKLIANELNVNELRIPAETHFFLLESPFKNVWFQIRGRATASAPFNIVSDEKVLTIGLVESEDKNE